MQPPNSGNNSGRHSKNDGRGSFKPLIPIHGSATK
jgi:hypothetical protein